MNDNGEYYQGCICKNGMVHPDCDKHQPITQDRANAQREVAEFLKNREEKK